MGRPSLTGRLLRAVPRIHMHRQHPEAAHGCWRYGGSVFDGFEAQPARERPVRRIVVTPGMERGFRRLLERLVLVVPPGAEVLWQRGCTPVAGLGIAATSYVPASALAEASARPTWWCRTPGAAPRSGRWRRGAARSWCRATRAAARWWTPTRATSRGR